MTCVKTRLGASWVVSLLIKKLEGNIMERVCGESEQTHDDNRELND